MLDRTTVLFTPNTILGWYRKLIAQKYNGSRNRRKVGRPQITEEIVRLIIQLKKENLRWGYQKITDQIVYLGYYVSKSSVKNILIENGFNPEPDLTVRSTWHEFIKNHLDVLAACDFFTVELLVNRTLIRCTIFFVIEIASRKILFTPIKPQPDGSYMKQVARILTDCEDGFLKNKKYLIHDRDPLYNTDGFYDILENSGIKPIKLPARSPNLNAYAERFVKSVKSECLDHLILSSVEQLEYALEQYRQYYNHERIHQSLGRIIEPKYDIDDNAEIQCIERLGGLLKSYHRLAA
jgi:putative transposase